MDRLYKGQRETQQVINNFILDNKKRHLYIIYEIQQVVIIPTPITSIHYNNDGSSRTICTQEPPRIKNLMSRPGITTTLVHSLLLLSNNNDDKTEKRLTFYCPNQRISRKTMKLWNKLSKNSSHKYRTVNFDNISTDNYNRGLCFDNNNDINVFDDITMDQMNSLNQYFNKVSIIQPCYKCIYVLRIPQFEKKKQMDQLNHYMKNNKEMSTMYEIEYHK